MKLKIKTDVLSLGFIKAPSISASQGGIILNPCFSAASPVTGMVLALTILQLLVSGDKYVHGKPSRPLGSAVLSLAFFFLPAASR